MPDRPSVDAHVDPQNQCKDDPSENPRVETKAERQSKFMILKQLWLSKTGIDLRTYMQMFKGALAPTIAISCYQATSYADTYTTIGYLVGITAVLSVVIQPRAKFLQTMIINIFATCLGTAIALLAMYCAVKARINSGGFNGPGKGGPGTSGLASGGAATARYNSSASAVAGVWLFVWIYGISVVRGKNPQFTIPCILSAIFANISMVYAPQFSTMTQAEAFALHLLEAFLTGFAIATGVSLFVFPFTSRKIVFKEVAAYINSLRELMGANLAYLRSLEETDVFLPHRVNTAGDEVIGSKEAEIFKRKMQALTALHAKFNTDLPFAKREVSLGNLGPDDLQSIFRQLRMVMLPLVGLSSMQEVFQRIAEERGWDRSVDFAHVLPDEARNESDRIRAVTVQEWHGLMRSLREPFGRVTQTIDEGLEHVGIILQLIPNPRRKKYHEADAVEASGSEPQPGERGFTASYSVRSLQFLESKKDMLRAWCAMHEIELPPDFFDDPYKKDFYAPSWMNEDDPDSSDMRRVRRQLFLSLYMEYLLFNISRRVYDLIVLAEHIQDSGKLSRTRLIVPGFKRLRKWAVRVFDSGDESHDDQRIDMDDAVIVYMGEAYKKKKDPEHLPPENLWEEAGNKVRLIAHFLASPASSFGFRCSCATLSIAIVAFLQHTQAFFTRERVFWAQIMISISMSPSTGQSVRGFLLRIFGTFIAMLLSWVAYYIVDGHTVGVLIFYFLFLHVGVYILIKNPSITPVGMISQITLTLVIGYELQVRKVGIAVAESNGQAYYPIYELAPIRLATVCGGLLLAYIWTIFPYPITDYSQLRQNLGRTLYLLANYYSILHETVRVRLRGGEGDLSSKESPGYKLEKARRKVFAKSSILLSSLRAQSAFVKFDLPIGGKFPRAQYQRIIGLMQSALNFMALVSIASADFSEYHNAGDAANCSQWLTNFRRLIAKAHVTSEEVTTLLALLSSAVKGGSPLPPYLRVPEAYQLSKGLDDVDRDILSVRHVAEPGYAAFAVIQIGTRCVIDDLKNILKEVKELVGVLDFSYHIVSTREQSRNASEVLLTLADHPEPSRIKTGKEE